MYGRKNWLGYLAIGLGLAALLVSLGGRMSMPGQLMQGRAGRSWQNAPAVGAQQPAAQSPAVPGNPGQSATQPQAAPGNPGTTQGGVVPQQRFNRGADHRSFARGSQRDGEGAPFGRLAGLLPLLGGLLVLGLGLKLFVGPGRRGGPRGGQAVSDQQNWQPTPAAPAPTVPQPQPAAPQPSQTPPSPPATGETTRMYDF